MPLTYPGSEWLYALSIGILVSAFALLHKKPPRRIAKPRNVDTDDCTKEFWTQCNKMNLKSLEERKAEHVEILFMRYTSLMRAQKTSKLSRDDVGGIFSYLVGVAMDSGEKFRETYEFYGLQSSLDGVVNKSHTDALNAFRRGLYEEFRIDRILRRRRRVRNADGIGIVAVALLAILFFLESDSQTVLIRNLAVLLAFVVSIAFLIGSLWVCLEIDRLNGVEA